MDSYGHGHGYGYWDNKNKSNLECVEIGNAMELIWNPGIGIGGSTEAQLNICVIRVIVIGIIHTHGVKAYIVQNIHTYVRTAGHHGMKLI